MGEAILRYHRRFAGSYSHNREQIEAWNPMYEKVGREGRPVHRCVMGVSYAIPSDGVIPKIV